MQGTLGIEQKGTKSMNLNLKAQIKNEKIIP